MLKLQRQGLLPRNLKIRAMRPESCEVCQTVKARRTQLNRNPTRALLPLTCVHADTVYSDVASVSGARYALIVVDDATSYSWSFAIAAKSDVATTFMTWWQTFGSRGTRRLVTDLGGEFSGTAFGLALAAAGVELLQASSGRQEQNGRCERHILDLTRTSRAMLIPSGLPEPFWYEALDCAVLVRRIWPSSANPSFASPYAMFHSEAKPRFALRRLRRFGCAATVPLDKVKSRTRWGPGANVGILIGYDPSFRSYRLFLPTHGHVITYPDPRFDETKMPSVNLFASQRDAVRQLRIGHSLKYSRASLYKDFWAGASTAQPIDVDLSTIDKDAWRASGLRHALPEPTGAPPHGGELATGRVRAPTLPASVPHRGSPTTPADSYSVSPAVSRAAVTPAVTSPASPAVPYAADPPTVTPAVSPAAAPAVPPAVLPPVTPAAPPTIPSASPAPPASGRPRRETRPPDFYVAGPASGRRALIGAILSVLGADGDDRIAALALAGPTDPPSRASSTPADSPRAVHEPQSVEEALSSPLWTDAMLNEAAQIFGLGVVHEEEYDPAVHRRVLTSKWVFKAKTHADGSFDKAKARLTCRGFMPALLDFDVFASVARLESFRMLVSLAVFLRATQRSSAPASPPDADAIEEGTDDVTGAFLKALAPRHQPIYVWPPDGLAGLSKRHRPIVWRLLRALYGLKEAPALWQATLIAFLLSYGFVQLDVDPGVFVYRNGSAFIFCTTWVDDLFTVGTKRAVRAFRVALHKKFETNPIFGQPVAEYLGQRFTYYPSGIALDQEAKARQLIELMSPHLTAAQLAKGKKTPMRTGIELQRPAEVPNVEYPEYRTGVAIILYLSRCTRPDLAHCAVVLSRALDRPSTAHWNALKHAVLYIARTVGYKLLFRYTTADLTVSTALTAYADASWANGDNRKSIGGHLVMLGGSLIAWTSKLQALVTVSTAESEYVQAAECVKDVIFYRRQLRELGFIIAGPTILKEDNEAAIVLAQSRHQYRARTRHIDVRYHLVRDASQRGEVALEHIPGASQLADPLSKSVDNETLEKHRITWGLLTHDEIVVACAAPSRLDPIRFRREEACEGQPP